LRDPVNARQYVVSSAKPDSGEHTCSNLPNPHRRYACTKRISD
jgi:hypothetical protein